MHVDRLTMMNDFFNGGKKKITGNQKQVTLKTVTVDVPFCPGTIFIFIFGWASSPWMVKFEFGPQTLLIASLFILSNL